VYRTLDVLEQLGLVRHGHGADGREEFHVGPAAEHGHLYCADCGTRWEIRAGQADAIVDAFRRADGFEVDLSHVTVVGRCAACVDGAAG
jgi:Fur family ferric uptake transcriptional regulator